MRPSAGRREGQASVEAVGGALAVLLAGLLGFQLLAAGYAAVMADHAAEAAALALVNGRAAAPAAHAAVPGWPSSATRVRVRGETVRVTLFPPSPVPFLRGRLAATGEGTIHLPAEAERS